MTKDIRYVNKCPNKSGKNRYKTSMKITEDGKSETIYLIWGDRVEVLAEKGTRLEVRARGRKGTIDKTCVGTKNLLEVYVIDVGQGDCVLYQTPDQKWHVIDGGTHNARQMTQKGAPNFIRWKFYRDLGKRSIDIENMILSHPDLDHFGGLINILEGKLQDGRAFNINVENFYHSGMGRFKSGAKLGKMKEGTVPPFPIKGHNMRRKDDFIYELLDDQESFANPKRKFADIPYDWSFARLAELVGEVPNNVAALSYKDEYVPGYGPGENDVQMRLLGPIIEDADKVSGLRELSSESKTRNGHSVMVRLDYGNARLMLTGDTNDESQRLTLSYIAEEEFEADVAKGCHHGAEDIYMKFVGAMAARATVISSGDNESYAHPRPVVMGASGFYGREVKEMVSKKTIPPLLYSTELARSVKLELPSSVRIDEGRGRNRTRTTYRADQADVKSSKSKYENLEKTPISTDLIYGLVNVRTDGKEIMCATMEEQGSDFDLKVFKAGA